MESMRELHSSFSRFQRVENRLPNVLILTPIKYFIGGFRPVKGRVFQYLPRVEQQWYLAFSVKPTGTHSVWSNLLHLTVGGNHDNFGDRIPAVWFNRGKTSLHICSAVNTNKNYCWNSHNLPLNKYTKVEIRQTWNVDQNKCRLIISLDNVVRHVVVNNHKKDFENVVFYASDPWHPAAKGVLKNLVFKNLPHGRF